MNELISSLNLGSAAETGLILVLCIGLTQWLKTLPSIKDNKFLLPFVSAVAGIAFGIIAALINNDGNYLALAVLGAITGFSACGIYDGVAGAKYAKGKDDEAQGGAK